MFESIFDTDVLKYLKQKYNVPIKKFTDSEQERIDKCLAFPDARPADFDGTLEAWLLRISIWGRISIVQKIPEEKVDKKITNDQFLDYIDDQIKNHSRGKWTVEELEVNVIRFYRSYWGLSGKNVTEELVVTIDLRDDLKKALKKARGFF